MRIIIAIVEIIVAIFLLSLIGFYLAIRPFRLTSTITPADLGLHYEKIEFFTSDKVMLRGWFIPAKKLHAKTIIFMHGYPADKGNILPAIAFLHRDFNLFLFDFRYFGESRGSYSTAGKNEVLDLKAAINYLKSRNINEVGVWGFSLGGAVALMAAPTTPEIKAIVAQSSYARLDWMVEEYYRLPLLRYPLATLTSWWGKLFLGYDIKTVSPAASAEKLTIPVLLIYTKQDEVVPLRHGELLETSLQHNPKAKVMLLDEGMHGQLIPDHDRIVSEFFQEAM